MPTALLGPTPPACCTAPGPLLPCPTPEKGLLLEPASPAPPRCTLQTGEGGPTFLQTSESLQGRARVRCRNQDPTAVCDTLGQGPGVCIYISAPR